jgi:hypothetical protein
LDRPSLLGVCCRDVAFAIALEYSTKVRRTLAFSCGARAAFNLRSKTTRETLGFAQPLHYGFKTYTRTQPLSHGINYDLNFSAAAS